MVDTIADLRAINPSTFPQNQLVLVLGYWAANDDGGGLFMYDAAGSDPDNGGTKIVPTVGPGQWNRRYNGPINVLWFGAKGDGATSETVRLQSAFDALGSGDTIIIPNRASYYRVPDQVAISTPCTVILGGEARSTDPTKLIFLVTANDVTFDFQGGVLRGPGTFMQASAAGSNYGGLVEFRGASTGVPITNCRVLNPSLIDPPWAGLYFRYADGWEIIGGTTVGGPNAQTGTNHFAILALDSINWTIMGFENRGSAGGGYPVQMFNNNHSGISSSPGSMIGCRNLGTWDKMLYQYIDGAIISGCYSLNISTGGSKESIRVGGRCQVTDNIVQGGIQVVGPDGANVSGNYIFDFDHVGIQFGPIGIIGAALCHNITCRDNFIFAATPGGPVTEIYEGIRIQSAAGVDIINVKLDSNVIVGADMVGSLCGGHSCHLGAISITSGRSYGGVIQIDNQIIESPGSHGIIIVDGKFITIRSGTIRNPGSDADGAVPTAAGIVLRTSGGGATFSFTTVDGVKVIDDRGGASRLSASVAYNGPGSFNQDMCVTNCVALGVKAGELGLDIGSPYGATYTTQIGGNRISYTPLIGQFVIVNSASSATVAHDGVLSGTVGDHTYVKATPLNAAAITLVAAAPLWNAALTARTSFRFQTWNGTTNAGTDALFQYEIVQ